MSNFVRLRQDPEDPFTLLVKIGNGREAAFNIPTLQEQIGELNERCYYISRVQCPPRQNPDEDPIPDFDVWVLVAEGHVEHDGDRSWYVLTEWRIERFRDRQPQETSPVDNLLRYRNTFDVLNMVRRPSGQPLFKLPQ